VIKNLLNDDSTMIYVRKSEETLFYVHVGTIYYVPPLIGRGIKR